MTTTSRHIIVLHRWRDRYAHYEDYLDHGANKVTYITTEVGVPGVPRRAAGIRLVSATDHLAEVRVAVRELASAYGPPSAIVALKEDDLMTAARLRVEWDLPGDRPHDLACFTDKYVMGAAMAEAGLRAPRLADAPDRASVRQFARQYGWPVIVKPHVGSSSDCVTRLDCPEDLDALEMPCGRPMLVQAFTPHPIYHVDGVFTGERIGPWRASRYVNTCLGFRGGDMLGSVEEDDPHVNAAIGEFAGQVLTALSSVPRVFHLEVFVESAPGRRPAVSFLEIGARVGGAEIPFLWREVHGYDLMRAAFQIALGERPQPAQPGDAVVAPVGGWLLAPAPAARPCRITHVTSMVGRRPGPYAEALLEPGQVLPAADAYYEHVGGRFRFWGTSSDEVRAAVVATSEAFTVRGEPLAEEVSAPAALRH